MSRKFLPFVVMGAISVGGCAATHPTAHSRYVDAEAYRDDRSARAAYAATPAADRVDPMDNAIREVREAADIDAALDAYSFGMTIDRSRIDLHKTYVRRMVDLGVPHLAAAAALKVVNVEPDAPLSLAVMAFAAGREGNMVDALTDITVAARRAPNDPFVQRTSGHLLAWYDNNPRPAGLPSTVRFALQAMHESLDDRQIFADAYNDAADYYHEQQLAAARNGPTTGPSTGAATEPAVANGSRPEALPGDETPSYAGGGGGGGPIAPPPVYEPYGPSYDEPDAFAPAYYGWGPGFILGGSFAYLSYFNYHHHHHGFDRDHHSDHNGTGDHGGVAHGSGGHYVGVTGRSNVFLPPPTGPRSVGSAAGHLTWRSSASIPGGFDRLNTGGRASTGARSSASFGSSLPRSNNYRARGSSIDAPTHGFTAARPDGIPSPAATSHQFTGGGTAIPAPSGAVIVGPSPVPAVAAPAPAAAAAGRSGGRSSGGGSSSSGHSSSGNSSGSGRR